MRDGGRRRATKEAMGFEQLRRGFQGVGEGEMLCYLKEKREGVEELLGVARRRARMAWARPTAASTWYGQQQAACHGMGMTLSGAGGQGMAGAGALATSTRVWTRFCAGNRLTE